MQVEPERVHQDLGQARERGHVIAEPLGKNGRAPEPQGREARGVAPLVVVGAVVEHLGPERGGDAVGRVGVALRGEQRAEPAGRVVEGHEGAVGVQQHRVHAHRSAQGIHGAGAMIASLMRRTPAGDDG